MIARCERAIADGTADVMQLEETGWGPNGVIYTPERVRIRTREAEALYRIVQSLRSALSWGETTHDIIVGQAAVERLRR